MNTQEKINAVRNLLDEIEADLGAPRPVVTPIPWAGAEHWPRAADTSLTLDKVLRKCGKVCVGVDTGEGVLALSVVGRRLDGQGWASWSHVWADRAYLIKGALGSAPVVDLFCLRGCVTAMDMGDSAAELGRVVLSIQDLGALIQVGLDPASSSGLHTALLETGVVPEKLVGVSRGWKMGGSVKTVEKRLSEGTLKHPGLPVMDWVARNAVVEQRANALTVTKNANPAIDVTPLIALFSAVGLLSLATS